MSTEEQLAIDRVAQQRLRQFQACLVLTLASVAALVGGGRPAVWLGMAIAFFVSLRGLWTLRAPHPSPELRASISGALKRLGIAYGATMPFSFGSLAVIWQPAWGGLLLLLFLQVLPWLHYAILSRMLVQLETELA